jgi:hypothetical protein
MTKEEAITEYCKAINEHDLQKPETKVRVRKAREALHPFLVKGKLPHELVLLGKGMLK